MDETRNSPSGLLFIPDRVARWPGDAQAQAACHSHTFLGKMHKDVPPPHEGKGHEHETSADRRSRPPAADRRPSVDGDGCLLLPSPRGTTSTSFNGPCRVSRASNSTRLSSTSML